MKAAAIFTTNMILQRQKPVAIWGQATPGAEISAELVRGAEVICASTLAGADGRWLLTLPAQEAGDAGTLTLSGEGERIVCENVRFGEVWLAGGQSNMELELKDSENAAQAISQSACDDVCFYNQPKNPILDDEALRLEQESCWQVCSPETSGAMSAVAYYFARKLQETLQVPVGIIDCYWGGTSISCWMSEEALRETPEGQGYIDRYEARIGGRSDAECEAELKAYLDGMEVYNARVDARKLEKPDITLTEIHEEFGEYPWPQPATRTSAFRPAGLYHSMLMRVCPYTLRGFLWYQGEEDTQHHPTYDLMMHHMADLWRKDWGDDLPLLYVQLPMWISCTDYVLPDREPLFTLQRLAQARAAKTVPNAYMVVTTDLGEFDDIHPKNKKTVGERLADAARNNVYGDKSVLWHGPELVSIQAEGDKIRLHLRHQGALSVNGASAVGIVCDEKTPVGFEVAGENQVYHRADAVIQGDDILLSSPEVAKPVSARYAYYDWGAVNLTDDTGLPFVGI